MNRFFIPHHWLEANTVQLKESYARQIMHVLRLKSGDNIVVLDNTGDEYEIELTEVKDDCVRGLIKEQRVCTTEPRVRLTLFQSLLKRDKFEWVLQKCTEVGVTQIVPVITRRSLVQKTPIKPQKWERWQTIMREAAEQCARARIPALEPPIDLSESLKKMNEIDLGLMASAQSTSAPIAEVMATHRTSQPSRIGLWIGPEGGFDSLEIEKAVNAGAACVGLGKRILRTETAAVVACALVLHELNEL